VRGFFSFFFLFPLGGRTNNGRLVVERGCMTDPEGEVDKRWSKVVEEEGKVNKRV